MTPLPSLRTAAKASMLLSASLLFAQPDGTWLNHVPPRERARTNPYASKPEAAQAGALLYRRNCASCHGQNAEGIGKHPSLRSPRVHQATDGDLHWLLSNGNLSRGMPCWSRLPDPERWQLVSYLHSLPAPPDDSLPRNHTRP